MMKSKNFRDDKATLSSPVSPDVRGTRREPDGNLSYPRGFLLTQEFKPNPPLPFDFQMIAETSSKNS